MKLNQDFQSIEMFALLESIEISGTNHNLIWSALSNSLEIL